jgi:hypothetical protein
MACSQQLRAFSTRPIFTVQLCTFRMARYPPKSSGKSEAVTANAMPTNNANCGLRLTASHRQPPIKHHYTTNLNPQEGSLKQQHRVVTDEPVVVCKKRHQQCTPRLPAPRWSWQQPKFVGDSYPMVQRSKIAITLTDSAQSV